MAEEQREPGVVLERPNREKASSKATKAIVVLLLLVSVATRSWPGMAGPDAVSVGAGMPRAYGAGVAWRVC
jgi:hypothetical protein